jgi:CelD/BcsL family acetyltransferase involved in cellulose biosynthesis
LPFDGASRRLVEVDACTDPLWGRLVQRAPSDVFHAPAWLRGLAETYQFEVRALVVLDAAGEPRAGLPFCRVDDFLGRRIVSLPFSDYCDPVLGEADDCADLLDRLITEGSPIALRCLHTATPLADPRLALAKRAKWHGADLQPELEALWQSVHPASRRGIRKAEAAGVQVRPAESRADLRAFFDLHLRVRKYKYRLLAQPFRFFERIWDNFVQRGAGALLLARVGNEVIGGTLYLEWKDRLYYKFNASAAADLVYRPNDQLIWEGIKYGKARCLRSLDFGLSDWDQEGLTQFKRKFASEERTISFLKYAPAAAERPAKQALASLGRLTELLTDPTVPDDITARAGDELYRYFC